MQGWVIELTVFTIALLSRGDITHYTWWGAAQFAVARCLIGIAAPADVARHRRAVVAVAVTSLLIMAAVAGMSHLQCAMLPATLGELGPWVYALGNFALHYYPALCAVAWVGRLPPAPGQRWDRPSADACLLLSAYCMLMQPDAVYGCNVQYPRALMVAGAAAAVAVEMAILAATV
jgi:hypothetical protein